MREWKNMDVNAIYWRICVGMWRHLSTFLEVQTNKASAYAIYWQRLVHWISTKNRDSIVRKYFRLFRLQFLLPF